MIRSRGAFIPPFLARCATVAGYSGTPLPKKLGISEGHRVALLGAPGDLVIDLPSGVAASPKLGAGEVDVIVLFVKARSDLAKRFGAAARKLTASGGLWVAWPKKSSGVATDLTEGVVREIALAEGLVDNKVCAIDETWSGLRCVHRVADRAALMESRRRKAGPRPPSPRPQKARRA
jgi:hypothetical protein